MKPLRSPVKVSLDITSRCNLSCTHCRHSPDGKEADELSFSEICTLIDDLARLRVFRLGLSGGEPFVRADAPEIIRYAASYAPGRVFVSTNGTLVDERLLGELDPAKGRLTLKISLDGTEEIHDAIRGREGAFAAACEALRLCTARGFRAEVTTTVSRDNLDYLADVASLAASLGCYRYHLVEILPVGKATLAKCLDPAARSRAWKVARQLQAEHPDRVVVKLPFAGGNPQSLRCMAGISECGILSDGSVVGCRLLPHVREGNVRDRSLSDMWSNPLAFSYFRSAEDHVADAACRGCRGFLSCGGGCRAYAHGLSGDPYARDPRCPGGDQA